MSDIGPGDVVVCVDASTPPKNTGFPPIGTLLSERAIYRVTEALNYVSAYDGIPATSVRIPDYPRWWFESWRFRKLNDEPDDVELVERIKACKPIRIGEEV